MSSTKTRIVKVCPHCRKSFGFTESHACAAASPQGLRAARPPLPEDPLIGATLGDRYEIKQRLSQGGMGVVYRARHTVLGRVVAIKIMLKHKDEAAQQRFLQEAQIASTLSHPNIVYISDFGVLDDGRSYIVMEYLQGQTLAKVLLGGALSARRSCRIAQQLADGLQAVHDKGIVHRDLKPDNILLLSPGAQSGREDFVKILDFGIALAGDSRAAVPPERAGEVPIVTGEIAAALLQRRFTVPGMVMGTPAYMSPQQAQGEVLDGRSDQYALGCILYEMLSGTVPFQHQRKIVKVLMGHISGRVVPLSERLLPGAISPALDAIVLRLLAKQPDERFASMAEVQNVLLQELGALGPEPAAEPLRETPVLPPPKRPGWRPAVPILVLMIPMALLLLGSGIYLGYRALLRPPDQALRELGWLRQRALAVLTAQLQRPEPELRQRAILALGQTHEAALRPRLEALLADPDAEIQRRAAEALGQLGDRAALPALRALAERTRQPLLQVAAAGALDQLGDSHGQKLLRNALGSPEPAAQLQAALFLCSAGEVQAQSVLRSWLGSGTAPDELLVDTLYRLASAGDGAARRQLLARLFRGGRPEVQLSAAASLAKLGQAEGRAVLYEVARRSGKEQALAARLLAAVDGSADLQLFRRILANRAATLAALVVAAEGLADAGQSDDARALASFLTHPDPRLRQTAASAIVELTGRAPATLSEQSLAWAEGAITDRSATIRSSAVATLGDAPGTIVPLLQKVLTSDKEPAVRRAAARALARRHERAALSALHVGLGDFNADVRKETMRAIERVGERWRERGDTRVLNEVKAWLTPLLDSADREEQVLASGILYQLGDDGQRARLIAWLVSPDEPIRRAALAQLARDRELLASVLADPSPAVRLVAARQLAELGDRRAAAVLMESLAGGGLAGLQAYALLRKLGWVVAPPADSDQVRFSSNVQQRCAALDAILALPLDELRLLLLAAASDSAPEVRLHAAELADALPLGPDNLPAGLAVLRTLLYDSDATVRMRARALLSRQLRPIAEREIAATRPPDLAAARSGPADDALPPAGATAGDRPPEPGLLPGGTAADPAPAAAPTRPPEVPRLPELIIEHYLASGITALEHRDLAKAQKLLERASSLCAQKGKHWKEYARLAPEIAFRLGSAYEAQGQWTNAAAEYQKLLPPADKAKTDRQKAAQAAMRRLSRWLGRIEISKPVEGRCEHGTLWMEPGLHRVRLGNGQSKVVHVQANQTVQLQLCSPDEPGRTP